MSADIITIPQTNEITVVTKPTEITVVSKSQEFTVIPRDTHSSVIVTNSVFRNGGSGNLVHTAGEAIGGHRFVILDASEDLFYASNTVLADAEKVLGMTTNAAPIGGSATVQRSGELEEPSWSWTLDTPIFLSSNGQMTQTRPSASGSFVLQVAFPITPTKVFIDLKQAIFI